ncbi:MAG: DUF2313 domain-containing protein [Peptococcaceae bacterium]|nr:DUF2313 domain-containing protein [Peptococcaceae bacterium]
MSYNTDMVEQIITSEEGRTILEYLSPIYGRSYVGLWMLQIIGMQLDKASKWTAELALQVTPHTATWTIEFWEKQYGIVPDDGWTLEQRQENIMQKMRFFAPITPKKLEEVASAAAGAPVEVRENTGPNTFHVLVRRYTESFDRAKELIDEAKPAHLIYTIQVAQQILSTAKVYGGVGVTMYQRFNVEVTQ